MHSIYKTVIEPKGSRYNNTKMIGDKEFTLNATINEKDFRFTNRIGTVIRPARTSGVLKKGDEVIVHHNVFRRFNNMRGKLVDSGSYVRDDRFTCFDDQMYAYKRDDEWKALEFYCFIEPSLYAAKEGFIYDKNILEPHTGTIFINNPKLEEFGLSKGDKVLFMPGTEYEFVIEGKTVYRMKWWEIIAKL